MVSGLRAGDGKAELKIKPLRDQISLAEKISSTPMIKEIARHQQKVKQQQCME